MPILMSIPGVVGETTLAGHAGKIDLLSCNWGLERPRDSVTGAPVGVPLPRLVEFTKRMDSSSAELGVRSTTGASLRDPVTIQFIRTSLERVRLTLTGVKVEALRGSVIEGGSPFVVEQGGLSYGTLTVAHFVRAADGTLISTQTFSFTPTSR